MNSFYERPILNSPYRAPDLHHPLDKNGQPLEGEPRQGRRPSRFIVPVPASRKRASANQASLDLETYTENALINEIRAYVDQWRTLRNPIDWGVTSVSQRLLEHWRRPSGWSAQQPFFCQVEAVETIIWLTEVAPRRAATKGLLDQIERHNQEANPELFRLAMKMATGSGKTTVMAMLIAWQAVNAARKESKDFSRAFLIVAPGITIKDRLRVLQPSEPDNYYETREIVPPEMLPDIRRAEIVITNYHAFQHREMMALPKVASSFLQGNDPVPLKTTETDAEMLKRACEKLLNYDRVNVINDEAHHCYRHKVGADAEGALTGDDKREAVENEEAARLWINGIEALDRKLSKGVRAVYDLSATPFFLRGSGYHEGTLFPWVVSDFSLMDAIESGIVKLPRVPVSDNLVRSDTVVYRDLWKQIGKDLPKTAAGAAKLSAFDLPPMLRTALTTLYSHYEGEFDRWERASIAVPPVFIVVCQNTAISRLVFEWIAGFERGDAEEGERAAFHAGHLELFRNYDDQGGRLPRPCTLLIDSRQIESGDALDKGFRDAAGAEIDQFKREVAARAGAGAIGAEVGESALLREVMNTVGRPGRLGEQIRCVVSVSMLTEGWDTNTVTHILGVRAFGTQLLCEQVVGRGLRRQSYDLNPATGLFDVEYADIMGIPFDFASSPQVAKPTRPKPVTRVHAIRERAALEIVFPRVSGYRRDLPSEKLDAVFTEDSRLVITPEDIGPTSVVMEGIVGAGVTITPDVLERLRPSEISFNLAKHLLYTSFRDDDGFPKQHLFPQIQRLARRWLDEGYLVTKGVPVGAILYQDQLARAAEKIDIACTRAGGGRLLAVLDPYNPKGSTRHVNFITSKPCWATGARPPKSQISHVVLDSSWEEQLALTLEGHPRVLAYAKNQALGFEIPYLDGGITRRYLPDFLVRLDDGGEEPINLVLEVKGIKDETDKAKAETTRDLWVPGVNALGGFGRWAFAEFRDWTMMEEDFAVLVEKLMGRAR
ncbi:restriction endonuclease [Kaistia algarum]|uniref:BPTD_3080 family restriction endonuclease n=1 Tax=Kaistia algarum TaxID=2083279 RepID=UPI000CE92376|nr:DEAD/DEAH box helicase family protein [Kaistia algarum]MCX5513007.1 DEAD/DEAH box helicase family protein [Kaistia algarum]PPE81510.1 restriction endonuclease [Kaistia algarum]